MDEEIKPIDIDSENINPQGEVEIDLIKAGSPAVKEKSVDAEEGDGQLSIDVYQTPEEVVIEAPIAGVKPEDLDITITNESVVIKGQREKETRIKEEDFFYQECYWGKFSRSIILPQEVDAEKAEASLKNGVLIIHLPKLSRQRSKKVKIKIE